VEVHAGGLSRRGTFLDRSMTGRLALRLDARNLRRLFSAPEEDPMNRRKFLRLAATGAATAIAPTLLAGIPDSNGSSPGSEAIHSETPDARTPDASRLLHYATSFVAPELRVLEGSAYRTAPMELGVDGRFEATLPRDAEVLFHVRDAASGHEDHPPRGGDYRLSSDYPEAWLEKGTFFDVDPRSLGFELIDAHTHPYARADDGGFVFAPAALLATERQEGIGVALTTCEGTLEFQRTNLLRLCRAEPWLVPLLWVEPLRDSAEQVEALLAEGFRGLKFHPTASGYPADGEAMDAFLALAERRRVPVQIHTAIDDNACARRFAALARRFPGVQLVMVHTELGAGDKSSPLALVRGLPNVYVELSWANPESVLQAMSVLDSSRTLFGTDASVDGLEQFEKRSIADPAGEYVYAIPDVVAKVRAWAHPDAFANWARLTAIRLYGLRFSHLVRR
jgi:hypothetical protein